MKNTFILMIMAILLLSLAACGSSGAAGKSESTSDTAAVQTVQSIEESETDSETTSETMSEASEDPQTNDDELIGSVKSRLTGNWTCLGMDVERLTFNEDGTGKYTNLNNEEYTFTYAVTAEHKAYGNGKEYVDTVMKIDYNTGDSENIIISFNERDQLVFHDGEGGIYSGFMNYFNEWVKQ